MSEQMALSDLMRDYGDGDELGWMVEIEDRWASEPDYMRRLSASIREYGVCTPIVLGEDGRVWDGHHRIAVAYQLGIESVPVVRSCSALDGVPA